MFEGLVTKAVNKSEQGILVSFPLGLAAIVRGSAILEYLHGEEVDDYTTCEFRKRRPPKEGFDFGWFEKLRVRFLSRAVAYVITLCNLDGILVRSYGQFLDCLQRLGYDALTLGDIGSTSLADRKLEIEDYRFYRDKVFAHTSFADPRKDSTSLQHSSLAYYSGNLLYLRDDYLALGGGSLIIDGQEESVPEVSIVGDYQRIIDHYTAWESMFTVVLDRISKDELTTKLEFVDLLHTT